ncbi:MAG: cytochrome c [Nitrospirae bacterium]|nr:cytochrome c [Nitrospirota bacterium]
MTNRTALFAVLLTAVISLSIHGCAKDDHKAEGTAGEHGEAAGVDEHTKQMVEQHEAMMGIQEDWTKARGGIEGGDAQAVLKSAEAMSEKSAAIEGFMLHKGADNREEFVKKATEFRSMIKDFNDYARNKDVKSLREMAPKIDAACNGCHQSFR